MPKRGTPDGGVADSLSGIWELKQIRERVAQEAMEYSLTPEEALELQNAYGRESDLGWLDWPTRFVFNAGAAHVGNTKPMRSPEEILEAAKKRKEQQGVPAQPSSTVPGKTGLREEFGWEAHRRYQSNRWL